MRHARQTRRERYGAVYWLPAFDGPDNDPVHGRHRSPACACAWLRGDVCQYCEPDPPPEVERALDTVARWQRISHPSALPPDPPQIPGNTG